MSPRVSSEKTPTVIVLSSPGETKTSEYRNSFHDRVKENRAAQITPGTATGRRILTRVWNRLHQSSMAHCSISFGTVRKLPLRRRVQTATRKVCESTLTAD